MVAAAAVVIVMAGAVALLMLHATGTAGAQVLVHGPDGYEAVLELDHDERLEVSTDLGTNVLVVRDGRAFMEDADCPNGDCLRQGAISLPGQQLICLPHRLWVEVVPAGGQPGEMDVDATISADADGESAADLVAR